MSPAATGHPPPTKQPNRGLALPDALARYSLVDGPGAPDVRGRVDEPSAVQRQHIARHRADVPRRPAALSPEPGRHVGGHHEGDERHQDGVVPADQTPEQWVIVNLPIQSPEQYEMGLTNSVVWSHTAKTFRPQKQISFVR